MSRETSQAMVPNRRLLRFIRPIMGSFFAAALMSGHAPQPKEFFGTAFWIGFTLQTIAAEIWINYTRPHQLIEFQSTTIAPAGN